MASFQDFAEVCEALGQTSSRLQLAQTAAEFLAQLSSGETAIAARFMIGQALAQGSETRLQISGRAVWRVVSELTDTADQAEEIFANARDFGEAVEIALRARGASNEPGLTLARVQDCFNAIAAIEGRNSRGRKLDAVRELFERATNLEGKYLAKLLIGEMRHGVSEGLMLEALARMSGRPLAEIRRAHQLEPDLGRLAEGLRTPQASAGPPPDGDPAGTDAASAAAAPAGPEAAPHAAGKPLRPMLAAPAQNVAAAFRILGPALALEHKLDGARVQIHCDGVAVRIYSRRLNEITASLPEIAELIAGRVAPRRAIFDGELIAIAPDGRPAAFQDLMRRFGRTRDLERARREQPVELFLFDLIAADGELLIDHPYNGRYARLAEIADAARLQLVERILPNTVEEAEQFYARTIGDGYEGVVAKALASLYTPGVRGRGWLKIKAAKTFDLVIVAADWGYGRRHGWLSNYHLAARGDPSGFAEVGKTFKGLTDADFESITERLLQLKESETGGTVNVRPEVVVEVAYSDITRSPQYPSGMALRFARIVGIRNDKSPEEADTIAAVKAAFERQPMRPRAADS